MGEVIPLDPKARARLAMDALKKAEKAKAEAERKARAVAAMTQRRESRKAIREAEMARWTPKRPGSGGIPYSQPWGTSPAIAPPQR